MTASKNANVTAGGTSGAGSTTSATTADGDYRLVPHEMLTSPTTSYEVQCTIHANKLVITYTVYA